MSSGTLTKPETRSGPDHRGGPATSLVPRDEIRAVACAVAVLPLAVTSQHQSQQVSWLSAPDASTLIEFARSLAGTALITAAIFVLLAVVGLSVPRLTPTMTRVETAASTSAGGRSPRRCWLPTGSGFGRPGLKVSSGEEGAINERDTLRSSFRQVSRTRLHGLDIALYVRRS